MDIGKEKRTIIVEPATNPVPERIDVPERHTVPRKEPAETPERTPVKTPEKV